MALNPQLSKASEVLGIRRNDRRHAVDIVCQVLRASSSSYTKFKFFTLEVLSDESNAERKCFTLKVWEPELPKVQDVVVTDIIRIRKAWRKEASRRPSTNYVLKPNDLDIEFSSHALMEVDILFSTTLEDVHRFSYLRTPRAGLTIRGTVDRLPMQEDDKWVVMFSDGFDVVEVQMDQSPDLKIGDFCKVIGDLVYDGGLLILKAKECTKLRTLQPAMEAIQSLQIQEEVRQDVPIVPPVTENVSPAVPVAPPVTENVPPAVPVVPPVIENVPPAVPIPPRVTLEEVDAVAFKAPLPLISTVHDSHLAGRGNSHIDDRGNSHLAGRGDSHLADRGDSLLAGRGDSLHAGRGSNLGNKNNPNAVEKPQKAGQTLRQNRRRRAPLPSDDSGVGDDVFDF